MKVLGIIPARGGSKGIPNKNRLNISGKPLIQYSLEVAVKSELLEDVWVSSDDDDILSIAQKFKVKLHKRPIELAGDLSPVTETVSAILRESEKSYDAVMILQPTSPLRETAHVDEAIKILGNNPETQSVISVVPMDDIHPARMYSQNQNNFLQSFTPEFEQIRRQDIPTAYYRNGAIYLTRVSAFLKNNSVMNKPITPLIMDYEWLLNIDSMRDVLIAEVLIPAWSKKNNSE